MPNQWEKVDFRAKVYEKFVRRKVIRIVVECSTHPLYI